MKTIKQLSTNIRQHKIWSIIVFLIAVVLAYWIYASYFKEAVLPTYALTRVQNGSIIQSVSGSGQISASNQTDIQSQVSGTIKSINVSVGQQVRTGEIVATIDSANAAISLENSRITLAKLTKPAKESEIAIAKSNLAKAYDSGFNAVAEIFLDLPTAISGMKDLLYSQDGYLSDQNSSFLSSIGRTYRDSAGVNYDAAAQMYQKTLLEYKNLSRASSYSDLDRLLSDTYTMTKALAEAVTKAQNAVDYISTNQIQYNTNTATEALANTTTWASLINNSVASVVSNQNAILNSTNSLNDLLIGSDALDIESARLNLSQAQKTYDNYFIHAPYEGVIGRIPVSVYEQAGSGTTIATIVGKQKIANISLNEVDAAKVEKDQNVKITFDAIDNFELSGTVSVVDQIGTVSNGVVSYGIKIIVNSEDSRIKPGMSVNTTIITKQKNNVLIVPSVAVKKQNGQNYVQVFNVSPTGQIDSNKTNGDNTADSSKKIIGTKKTASLTTALIPQNITVTVGDSDDINTEIVSGLSEGQYVVTKTTTTAVAQMTTAPSILSGIGNRNPTSGVRATGATIRTGN